MYANQQSYIHIVRLTIPNLLFIFIPHKFPLVLFDLRKFRLSLAVKKIKKIGNGFPLIPNIQHK